MKKYYLREDVRLGEIFSFRKIFTMTRAKM